MPARFRLVFCLLGRALSLACAAIAQTPAIPPPQAPAGFSPPAPHTNAPLGEIPSMPGNGDGAYKTHQYRDLFGEQGHSPAESQANIQKAFQQLFHGDGQEELLYFESGANADGPLAYITDWANNDARTEGMSYGMMIAVQMNRKREFDALWNWANTYMLITDPKNPSIGYFAWSMATDGSPRSTGAAPGPVPKAFIEELWNLPVPSGEQRYYDGMLYLMSLLHCSGNVRIIDPHDSSGAP